MLNRYSQFVEGLPIELSNNPDRKRHAVWIEEVKSRRGWTLLRTAACGARVIPQVERINRKKYLKRFEPDHDEVCKQCLRVINSRLA